MLELLDLHLDGFMSYDQPIDFKLNESGITYIKGSTGSGKSTVFEAIYYLLIGETIRQKGTVKNLINKIVDNGYDVWLTYTVDKDNFKVREVRDRSDSGLFFIKNGEDVSAKTPVETRKKIIESLGMSVDDFKSIAFVGQNQANTLVTGTSGERSKEIIRIYGLDKYDQAIKNCEAEIKEALEEKKLQNNKQIEIESQIKDLNESISNLSTPEDATVEELEKLEDTLTKTKEKTKELKNKELLFREKQGKIQELERQKKLYLQLKDEIKNLETSLSNCKTKEQRKDLETVYNDVNVELVSLNKDISRMEAEIEKYKAFSNICPVSKEECEIEIPLKLRDKNMSLLNIDLSVKKENYNKTKCKKMELLKEVEELEKEKSLRIKLEEKKRVCIPPTEFDEDIDEIISSLEKYKKGVSEGETRVSSLSSKIETIKANKRAFEEYKKTLEKIKSLVENKHQELVKISTLLEKNESQNTLLSASLLVFKKLKAYKIDLVLDMLNENLQKNLDMISNGKYKAYFISQKKDSTGKRTIDQLDIMVDDGNKEIPIGMVSGGQAAQVSIAILLSVYETARTITNKAVSSLWLDEVFGPISTDIVDNVFESIIELTKRLGTNSVKVISHKDLDARFFNAIWEVKLENGISTVSFN